MNNQKRRKFTPEFKAKVALEALKEQSTLSEIAKILKSVPWLFPVGNRNLPPICRQYLKNQTPVKPLKKMLTLKNCMLKSGS